MKSPLSPVQAVALVATSCWSFAVAPAVAARPPSSPRSAVAAADAFMARRAPSLHATSTDSFVRGDVRAGTNGLKYVPYTREHAGLPVIGGDVVVATDARHQVIGTEVAQDVPITVRTTATVTAAAAISTARRSVAHVATTSTPRLVITAVDGVHLAWETVLTGTDHHQPTHLHVFTDAHTGKGLGDYDDMVAGTGNGYYSGPDTTIPTTADAGTGTYSMVDPDHPTVSCSDQGVLPFRSPDDRWGNGSGTHLESACVDALHGADEEWRMLGTWLDRDGFDGRGHGYPMRVGSDSVNAYWYGHYAVFGHSSDNARQATSLDIVGHELGHAIFGSTGLGGSGAMNEGTADIFGTLTEHYANERDDTPDYLIGERDDFFGGGAVRNFYDPAATGGGINCWSADVEDQEPHAAAGVLDHWFYLLAEGSATAGRMASPICEGGPASVTGLGQVAAARIFYNALQMKSYSWGYPEARTTTLQAARNLHPHSCAEFTRVKDAWDAVGVGAQPNEPDCPTGAGAFGLAVWNSQASVIAGKSTVFTVRTTLDDGSARQVTLSATGLPAGATVEFTPERLLAGTDGQARLSLPKSVPAGALHLRFTGTSGAETHSVPASLDVRPWLSDDFTMSVDPASFTMPAGGSRSLALSTAITAGAAQQVELGIDHATLPPGAGVHFPTYSLESGTDLDITLRTTADTPPGTYPLTIVGNGDYRSRNASLTYTVTAPDVFSFDLDPAQVSIAPGTSRTVSITSAVVSGTARTITWGTAPQSVPAGVTATFSPATVPAGGSTTMTLTAAAGTAPGNHVVELLGMAGSSTQRRSLPMRVTGKPQGFCAGYTTKMYGALPTGATRYQPTGGSFTAPAGTHAACLDGPDGTDFDLYLQVLSPTGTWSTVATADTAATDEKLTHTGAAGTYRYKVVAYAGSGSYKIAVDRP